MTVKGKDSLANTNYLKMQIQRTANK